ncbi:LTA synthase family protein [Methylobacterium sp. C25]|uniref:LTA synthase family protein n=1 Tax=Methylobacterium sp. C25 TaxID=2721622 RepID=UPI001F40EA52|nr:LTA synthase family protein [Methylobacterium sp. C25]MCE4225424.1 LTA synthase family protein [Methylobacterium sp. C25]
MSVILAFAVALVGSFAIEAAAAARRVSLRPGDVAIRLGSYALITAFWFVFSWRPWLAGASTLTTIMITMMIDALKRRILGESLVFSDVALLRQVPRHPDLYYTMPLTHPRIAVPLLLAFLGVAAWYAIEPTALPGGWPASLLAILALPSALLALWFSARTGIGRAALADRFPAPDLEADVARYGVLATMFAYLARREAEAATEAPPEPLPLRAGRGDEVVVVVQLESFLDPARLGGEPLPAMARIDREAAQHGRLAVPTHGAYTMRSEHALLTGREGASLGFGGFDPYLSGGGHEPTSLARLAKKAGYETVFVHPYHRDFFDRESVMRALGFDRLVMYEDFSGAPRVGPYIGDAAVAGRILAEVRERTGPILIFCATMENHGPWKPGRIPGIDDPLAQYLHHVGNAGRAVETLIDGLSTEPATLCVYGDHAPSLPCYRPGDGDPRTDYALFQFGRPVPEGERRLDLRIAALGCRLRDAVAPEAVSAAGLSVAVPRS